MLYFAFFVIHFVSFVVISSAAITPLR